MSVNAITSVRSSSVASSSSSALSEDTKKKLQAVGLDPAKYTSETQAQQAIKEAEEKKEGHKKAQGANPFETIKTEVQELASAMGLTVGGNDKISDIMSNISDKISELKSTAGSDQTKLSEIDGYNSQFTTISTELAQMEAAKSMKGATALANYNKAALGLT